MENQQPEKTQAQLNEEAFDFIQKEVDSAGLSNDLTLSLKTTYSIEEKKLQENLQLICKLKNVAGDNISKVVSLQAKLKEQESDIIKSINIPITLKPGNSFLDIRDVEILFSDEKTDIKHVKGQVILLDIWATWCGPCQKPMEHNQKMLEKNAEQWKDKVRIVGLSVDDEKATVIERVNSKNWKSVEHYKVTGGWNPENDALKYFQVEGIPKVVLVDTNGIIVYSGHPSSINLEEKINALLEGKNDIVKSEEEEEQEKQQQDQGPSIEEAVFNQCHEAIKTQYMPILEKTDKTFNFNLNYNKEKIFSEGKVVNNYYPITITYRCEIEQKQELDQFLSGFYEKVDKSKVKDKGQINDPKGLRMKHINKFSQIYQDYNLKAIKLSIQKSVDVVYRQKKFVCQKNSDLKQLKKLGEGEYDDSKLAEINKKFIEYGDQLYKDEVDFSDIQEFLQNGIETSIVNTKFAQMDDMHLFQSKDIVSLIHQPGQVLLVDFWAFWCGPCIGAMNHNQKILEENSAKWGDKVKMVAVSLESENQEVVQSITSHKWDKISFYHTQSEFRQRKEMKLYKIRFIPHILIINKEGILVYSGSPNEIKLEEKLQQLFEGQEAFKSAEEENQEGDYQNQYQLIKSKFSNENNYADLNDILSKLNYQPKISISIKQKKILDYKGNLEQGKKVYTKPQLTVSLRECDKDIINQLLDKIQPGLTKDQFTLKEEYLPTTNIPLATKCQTCQKALNDKTPYYWCQPTNEIFCISCGDLTNPLEYGLKKYAHLHNMVYVNINGNQDLLKNVDSYKFGKDLQPKEDKEMDENHSMCCNGCGGGATGRRYICLSCRPGPMRAGGFVDFCQNCFDALNNKQHPDHEKVFKHCENEGHQTDHLYLKILFNVGGYYSF